MDQESEGRVLSADGALLLVGSGMGKMEIFEYTFNNLVDQGRRVWEITIITMFFLFFKETRRIFWTHKKKSIQFWRSSSKGVISVSWLYCSCKLCLLVNWDYLLCVMTFEAVPCSGVYVAQRTECDCRQVEVTRPQDSSALQWTLPNDTFPSPFF